MKKRRQLFQDILILLISIGIAILAVRTGVIEKFILSLDGFRLLVIFISGLFFTSFFTTAPSIVLLGTLAQTTPLITLAVVGGLGAALGDYIIFRFVKDRISEDVKYLLSFQKGYRLPVIFKTRLFKFFIPLVASLIIASPFPDEIGVAMLGLSKMKNRVFLLISLILNGAGILIIGWVAKEIAGL